MDVPGVETHQRRAAAAHRVAKKLSAGGVPPSWLWLQDVAITSSGLGLLVRRGRCRPAGECRRQSVADDIQGERILIVLISGQSRLKELEKVGVVPTGQLALGLDAALVGALALGE